MPKKSKKQKRNPVYALQFTLSNANDYLKKLCELYDKQNKLKAKIDFGKYFTKEERDEWRDIALYIRAIKTALILEISKLFDTYGKRDEVISFKKVDFFQIPTFKKEIDLMHGESIIAKILDTRHTWSAHIGQNINDIISTKEIYNSNLSKIFEILENINTEYIIWFN